MELMELMLDFFTVKNTLQMLLALLVFIVIWTLIQLQRNPNDGFDIKDLVGTDGKLDEKKFTRFGAWVVSTWGFVYLLVNETQSFPEWYFIGYMAAWVANVALERFSHKPQLNTKSNVKMELEDPPARNTRND